MEKSDSTQGTVLPDTETDSKDEIHHMEIEENIVRNDEEKALCNQQNTSEEKEETFEDFMCMDDKDRRDDMDDRGSNEYVEGDNTLDQQASEEESKDFQAMPPLPDDIEINKIMLLDALKEVEGLKDPDLTYSECCENVRFLKEQGVLNKYILNDEEAGSLCAIEKLHKARIFFKNRLHTKLGLLILRSFRKLPRYTGTLYFGRGSDRLIEKKAKGEIVPCYFCVGSSSLSVVKDMLRGSTFKEIIRVENCWGYDISDFSHNESGTSNNCK